MVCFVSMDSIHGIFDLSTAWRNLSPVDGHIAKQETPPIRHTSSHTPVRIPPLFPPVCGGLPPPQPSSPDLPFRGPLLQPPRHYEEAQRADVAIPSLIIETFWGADSSTPLRSAQNDKPGPVCPSRAPCRVGACPTAILITQPAILWHPTPDHHVIARRPKGPTWQSPL